MRWLGWIWAGCLMVAAAGAAAFTLAAPAWSQDSRAGDGAMDALLDAEAVTGAILVRRVSDGAEWTGGGARVDRRFLPASSYKIANSLIILETGVVADPDEDRLAWDGVERGGSWDQDQSLRTGMRRSAVWAYQEWARRVGHARMQARVSALDYGNGDIGPPEQIDQFWLTGPLEISAREQVDFLQRLHARALPVEIQVQNQVIDILEYRRGDGWVLRAKTGWAIRDEPGVGWLVGWLEADAEVWLFAVNVDLDWETGEGAVRERLARAALAAAGAPIPQ